MKKREKEALLIAFLQEKPRYERFGEYIIHLIKDDPSAPKRNFHTIIYRIKDEQRIIEKIEKENKNLTGDQATITVKNYQQRIGDLLGIRLICLRLADIKVIDAYFQFLAEEKIFKFIDKPEHKRSFILPVDPGETAADFQNLMYSGYSSIHFHVELGSGLNSPKEFGGLRVEFQLRTILEEAWGEIDHKYRYTFNRRGGELPEYIHSGFYNLSAYLQAAAMQAEYLCRQVEEFNQFKNSISINRLGLIAPADIEKQNYIESQNNLANHLPEAQKALEKIFGFKPTERTILYILKRFQEAGYSGQDKTALARTGRKKSLQKFRAVFSDILGREPFIEKNRRNVDVVNAVNYVLYEKIQGERVALEGLRLVLRNRKERAEW